MFQYWVVNCVYCFDTCVSKEHHNFRTEEEANKYYESHKKKLPKYFSLDKPRKITIRFEKEAE